jgi:hypothetical protein
LVRQSLVPSALPSRVDDLKVEEALVDELKHSRLASSSFLVAPWLLASEE